MLGDSNVGVCFRPICAFFSPTVDFLLTKLCRLFSFLRPPRKETKGLSQKPAYEALTDQEYRQFFEELYVPVRNYLYFKVGDNGVAEDIAQDTFIKLWQNRGKIDKRTVKSYLYTIAGNLAINHLKRQQLHYKFQNQSVMGTDIKSPEYTLQMKEYEEQLNQALSAIPEGPREVFLMNRLEDLKYREIAERLGLSVKAVEKRMSKALQLIRENLGVDL